MEKSDAVDTLAALAQDTRLDIFRTLVEYQPAGLPAGLITSIRDGRSLIYSANTDAVDELAQYLQEDCCSKSLDD